MRGQKFHASASAMNGMLVVAHRHSVGRDTRRDDDDRRARARVSLRVLGGRAVAAAALGSLAESAARERRRLCCPHQ